MRVVMPLARIHPEAIAALTKAQAPVEFVNVLDDPLAYWRLFVRLWSDGEPFVIVEHDIVVRPDTIKTLRDCGSRWCAYVYKQDASGNPVSGLGCTKIEPAPWRIDLSGMPEPVWQNVDTTVAGVLTAAGWEVHEHGPALGHLNPRVQGSENQS